MNVKLFCLVFVFLIFGSPAEAGLIEIRHYQSQCRYDFGLKLLHLAMDKTGFDYKITASDINMNEARGEHMVVDGDLDLQFMSTTEEREKKMIPVKVPIYRGLLGMRLLLIKKNNKALTLKKDWDVNELRKYIAGHGRFWGDLPVYGANNLPVIPNTAYDGIFKQLIYGRIDYFHRGVAEIWEEVGLYENSLVVAENVMLFYKHPVYFFITKTRPELAETIKSGLSAAIKDGSYKKLFLSYFDDKIKKASLEKRKLIVLRNPTTPKKCPPIDTSWWAPEMYLAELSY